MEELWKDIHGYEGLYKISNFGNVKSLNYRNMGHEQLLTPKINNSGRLWVELRKKGEKRIALIHRLVCEEFIDNPNNYLEVNHKDENPQNNVVTNLEWCTHKYNVRYYYQKHPSGSETRKSSKLAKKINQYTTDGRFVKCWENSRTIFKKTGMSDWSITECCRGNRSTAYGYIWQYVN